jgi:hypothetical protein
MQAEGIFKAVGKVGFGGAAQSAATAWLILPVPGEPNTSTGLEITLEAGALFPVSVGRDCEPLWVGLCRYPPRATLAGRSLATRLGKGWHLSGFSKTQFASLHGWASACGFPTRATIGRAFRSGPCGRTSTT